MITSHYINEGATLVLNAGDHPHYIPVTDDTRAFCDTFHKHSQSSDTILMGEALERLDALYRSEQDIPEYGGLERPEWLRKALSKFHELKTEADGV